MGGGLLTPQLVWMCMEKRKSFTPTRIWALQPSSRSELLYWLRYPGCLSSGGALSTYMDTTCEVLHELQKIRLQHPLYTHRILTWSWTLSVSMHLTVIAWRDNREHQSVIGEWRQHTQTVGGPKIDKYKWLRHGEVTFWVNAVPKIWVPQSTGNIVH